MDKEVENFINECKACQGNAIAPNPKPLNISELPKGSWIDLSYDFFGSLASGD